MLRKSLQNPPFLFFCRTQRVPLRPLRSSGNLPEVGGQVGGQAGGSFGGYLIFRGSTSAAGARFVVGLGCSWVVGLLAYGKSAPAVGGFFCWTVFFRVVVCFGRSGVPTKLPRPPSHARFHRGKQWKPSLARWMARRDASSSAFGFFWKFRARGATFSRLGAWKINMSRG